MRNYRIAIFWDDYNSQVRGALLADCLLLQKEYLNMITVLQDKDPRDILVSAGITTELLLTKNVPVDFAIYYVTKEETSRHDVRNTFDRVDVQRRNTLIKDLRQEQQESQISERVVVTPLNPSFTTRPAPPSANPLNRPPPSPYAKPMWVYGTAEQNLEALTKPTERSLGLDPYYQPRKEI